MQSSFTMAHLSRPSLPVPREMYFSFGHLHKSLAPVVDESDDSEEERPRKKEAWRKRLHIPDYRKVKIGEYYDEDLDISCSGEGESDISARSSFESEKSIELKTPTPVLCAGCNLNFSPSATPASTPAIEKGSSSCDLVKSQQGSHSKKLRVRTITHTKYRCLWPGCRIILCAACANLMSRPKTSGGMGGSLSALQNHLEQYRSQTEINKATSTEAVPKPERADGAITADIVEAATSTSTSPTTARRPNYDVSETINVVNHAVAAAEGKTVKKAVAEIITQKELSQKLGAAGLRDNGEITQSGVHSGIVVTVKELGFVGQPKAL